MKLSKKASFIVVAICLLLFGIGVLELLLSDQSLQGSFGIYLSSSNQPIISDRDIVWYNWSSHEIKLTNEGLNKVESLNVPVSGTPFTIKLDGKGVYNGSFWVSLSSISSSGIVIDVLKIQNSIVKIEVGYPSSEFFKGTDPRANFQVYDYLQKIGKLV